MARMYGTYARPRCPSCRAASGPDCADASRGKGAQRKYEERQWRRDWADDIDDAWWERWDLETLRSMICRTWGDDVLAYLDEYYDYRPTWAYKMH